MEREDSGRVLLDFWTRPAAAPAADEVRAALADAGIAGEVAVAPETVDWEAAIRDFHRPLRVGPLRVRPPWEPAEEGTLDVVIDPGMAFGTGQHATTRGCLEILAGLAPAATVDVGCGSGVLAIAAARLGAPSVVAVDIDPEAVAATEANARANGVDLDVRLSAAGRDPLPAAPTMLANMTLTDLAGLRTALPDPPPQRIVASGVRVDEVDALGAEYARSGYRPAREVSADGWSAVLLERTA